MGLVGELPRLGYDVRAWSNFRDIGNPGTSHYHVKDGVQYRALGVEGSGAPGQIGQPLPFEPRDVLLCYYDTSPLAGVSGERTLRVASHHTYQLPYPGTYEWADLNVAPSQHAVEALRTIYGGRWAVMPNGIPVETLPEWRPVPGRCVWHTSASRGLWNLLEAWPEIRRRVPNATLHVVGDVAGWLSHYEGKGDRQAKFADRVRDALAPLAESRLVGSGDMGVKLLGKLPRKALLRELSEASCFPFAFESTAPCETFSVCTMECLAVGMPVLTTPRDAMWTMYGETDMIESVYGKAALVERLHDVLTIPLTPDSHGSKHRRAWARGFTFERKAKLLDRAIRETLAR